MGFVATLFFFLSPYFLVWCLTCLATLAKVKWKRKLMTWEHPTKKSRSMLSCARCPIFHNLILFQHPSILRVRKTWLLDEFIAKTKKIPHWQSGFFEACSSMRKVLMPIDCYYNIFSNVQCCVMICDLMQTRQPVWSVVFKLCIKYKFMKLQWRSNQVWNERLIGGKLIHLWLHHVANVV